MDTRQTVYWFHNAALSISSRGEGGSRKGFEGGGRDGIDPATVKTNKVDVTNVRCPANANTQLIMLKRSCSLAYARCFNDSSTVSFAPKASKGMDVGGAKLTSVVSTCSGVALPHKQLGLNDGSCTRA